MTEALGRIGGYLLGPRAHAAVVEPGAGRWDAVLLGALYAVGTSIYPIAESLASLWAVRNWGGVVTVAAALGRALIAPVLLLVIVETVLGSTRAYQRAAGLLPLVLVATAAHAARQMGWALPGGPYMPEILGGLLGVGLAFWIKPAIVPERELDA